MVSQTQRLARTPYKEAHPDQFPKPKFDADKKKKKSLFKKTKQGSSSSSDKPMRKGSSTRHPLLVRGMKPGEGCYICNCKSKTHIDICLQCRRRGHSLKNCPDKNDDSFFEKKLCYNCGDTCHSLSHCPQPLQDVTKFASCFILKEHMHISKNCPQNKHGVFYPMVGEVVVKCVGVWRISSKTGPDKLNRDSAPTKTSRFDATPREKITKFSGDDLEDDFYEEPKGSKKINKTSDETITLDGLDEKSISKKKQGPKVVNFFG